MKPTLTVLSRDYCHLCEELLAGLRQFQGRYDFAIEVIDVDSRPELEERWGELVPVVLDGDREICHHFLDVDAVDARLARMK